MNEINEKIETTLPNGDVITVVHQNDPNFPGIHIKINGMTAVYIEENKSKSGENQEETRIVIFKGDSDDEAITIPIEKNEYPQINIKE